jgi:hypothetical protein
VAAGLVTLDLLFYDIKNNNHAKEKLHAINVPLVLCHVKTICSGHGKMLHS